MTGGSLTTAQLDAVAELVRRRVGLAFPRSKAYLVEGRLQSLARRRGQRDANALVRELDANGSGELLQAVVEALVISETSFFRDPPVFRALGGEVLPRLAGANERHRAIRIWSAGAASGQEAYSVAMLLAEGGWLGRAEGASILASDVSAALVARIAAAAYRPDEVRRGLPARLALKYLTAADDHYVVRADLRQVVVPATINLLDAWPEIPPPDLVLLRNVLMHLDLRARQQILARLAALLRPGAVLVMGTGENPVAMGGECFAPWSIGPVTFFRRTNLRPAPGLRPALGLRPVPGPRGGSRRRVAGRVENVWPESPSSESPSSESPGRGEWP